MATVSKVFHFATDAEGFVATPDANSTLTWDGTTGNPAGALKARTSGRNKVNVSYWEWTGTWEALGVPAGSTVTAIRVNSGYTRCTEYATGASSTVGPYEYRDSGGILRGTLWTGRTITGTDGAWVAIGAQADVTVGASDRPSNTTIILRLQDSLNTGAAGGAAVSTYDDEVEFVITYTAPTTYPITPSGAVTPAGAVTLSKVQALPVSGAISPSGALSTSLIPAPDVPSPTLVCGFECGIVTGASTNGHWSNATGSPAIDTVTVRSGTRSLKIVPAAGSCYLRYLNNASADRLVGRFYFRLEAWPTATVSIMAATVAVGSSVQIQIDASTHQIEAQIGGDVNAAIGPNVVLNQWYCVDFDAFCGTNGFVNWRVDGVDQPQSTTTQAATTFSTGIRFGTITADATFVGYIDDVVVSETAADYPFGPGHVSAYRPNADGTHNLGSGAFTVTSNVFASWDDDPNTSTADRVDQTATDATAYLEVGFPATSEGTPRMLNALVMYESATTSANDGTLKLRDTNGGTEDNIFSGDLSDTGTKYKQKAYGVIPGTVAAWTTAAFNALRFRFGFSSNATVNPGVHSVVLEVEFSDAASGSQFTISPSGAVTSAGAIARRPGKAVAGSASSAGGLARQTRKGLAGASPSAGALVKRWSRTLTGATSSAGALSTIRTRLLSLAGAIASSGVFHKQARSTRSGTVASGGTLARRTAKPLSGAASSAGSIVRQTRKAFAGSAASAGSLGVVRAILRSFSGAIASSGGLARQGRKALAGSISPAQQSLSFVGHKVLGGSVASSGSTSIIKTLLRSFSGAIGSAGALAREGRFSFGGTVASSGSLIRRTARSFAGALASAATATVVRPGQQFTKSLSGAISSSGAVARRTSISLAGAAGSAGSLARQARRHFAGVVASSGSALRQTRFALSGAVASSGAVSFLRAFLRSFAGAIGSSGSLSRATSKALGGTASPAGSLARRWSTALGGSIAGAGGLSRRVGLGLSGSADAAGSLARSIASHFDGAIDSTGSLTRQIARLLGGALDALGQVDLTVPGTFLLHLTGAITPAGSAVLTKLRTVLVTAVRDRGSFLSRSRGSTGPRS